MSKPAKPLFEKLDYCKGSESFGEYVRFHENLDPVLKERDLINFVTQMPLTKTQRRNLIKTIKAPLE